MNIDKYIKIVSDHLNADSGQMVTICNRDTSGICVKYCYKNDSFSSINYIYFGYTYFGTKNDWYSLTRNIKYSEHNKFSRSYYINRDNPPYDYVRVSTDTEDPNIYTNLYDYGLLSDINHFIKILRLFMVVPRDARPINRLAFLDISVKTE
jgi:hypothetical protein